MVTDDKTPTPNPTPRSPPGIIKRIFFQEFTFGDAPIRIEGVGSESLQGDVRFVEAAQAMGAAVQAGPNWLEVRRGAWITLSAARAPSTGEIHLSSGRKPRASQADAAGTSSSEATEIAK